MLWGFPLSERSFLFVVMHGGALVSDDVPCSAFKYFYVDIGRNTHRCFVLHKPEIAIDEMLVLSKR